MSNTALKAGTPAPDFSLHATPDQLVSLSDFEGRPVILAFYPADWSPVCGDQMALYNEVLPEFHRLGAELLGISVDGAWCHAAFSGGAGTCIFRCCPTSSPRAPSPASTGSIATATGPANGPSSSSTGRGSSAGVMSRRSG